MDAKTQECVYRGMRRSRCEKCGQWDSDHCFWERQVETPEGMRHDEELAVREMARIKKTIEEATS